ncbi:hypothetical protein PUNSTDRAFT_130611 [Punctularia strigosozonata HHB-11173 SS5]|uniref:uncharacterized protein n=1 Tax=Punctularia strigosozonata (strain HHB-11173) TaxID=741275 RepID=UPI0004418245|nr:uncharacterized protein PUNSTDRAFT_130611 [Punctularia strigosozonata HHB-11173 SS5]EIN12358.1 hypothetical protein PUNSTDRAFT_130611 [Punctularia strigosozonata HHB-11173 SS5]
MASTIIRSIEKHWWKADQDVFIATLFLNPYLDQLIFKLTPAITMGIIKCMYQRVFCTSITELPLTLLGLVLHYTNLEEEFSDINWPINGLRDGCQAQDSLIDPSKCWQTLGDNNPLSKV